MRPCLPLLLLFLVGLATAAPERGFDAFVLQVVDGDTIDVVPLPGGKETRIRLAGIDAPERAQPHGAEATRALSLAILGREVRIRVEDVDRYGRTVGRVFLEGGDVNHGLVRAGLAWAYRQYTRDAALLEAEATAQSERRGLWTDSNPQPPWAWRAARRRAESPSPGPAIDAGDDRCGTRSYCSEMRSCAEARFFLENCGLTRLDGDGDGVPCESICRN